MRRSWSQARGLFVGLSALTLVMASATGVEARIHPGNYVTKQKTARVVDGARGGATAKCPNGDRIVTGGAYWHQKNANGDPTLLAALDSSGPTANAGGWYAAGFNHDGQTLDLTVIAKCLPTHSFGAYSIRSRNVTVDPGLSGDADLRCGSGQKVITGGGVWQRAGNGPDASLNAHITSSIFDYGLMGWTVAGRNEGTVAIQLHVTAFCVASTVLGSNHSFGGGGETMRQNTVQEQYDSCQGNVALGGGTQWLYTTSPSQLASDTRATIISSSPTGDGTSWYMAVSQNDPHESVLFESDEVICLPA